MKTMRVAVLDLGSTSFHLLVVDVDEKGRITRIVRRREVVHMAADGRQRSPLPVASSTGAVRAARVLRRAADTTKPDVTVAAATHSLREAAKGADLFEQLSTAVRCPIRLLDGSEEARIVYEGVQWSLPLGDAPTLVVDLGGGSLELAVGIGGEVVWDASYALGASRLTETFTRMDPPTQAECDAIVQMVYSTLEGAEEYLANNHPFLPCISTGGTARALARLDIARRGVSAETINGVVLPTARLNSWATQLSQNNRARRMRLPGMAERRVDVLPAGALVLSTLSEQFDLPGITVSDGGLREGLVLEAIAHTTPELTAAR